MKKVCPYCDHEGRPVRGKFRVGKRRYKICRNCRGILA